MGRVDGKRALISGTGGGIGRATALLCAREGAHVVGCDLNPETSTRPSSSRGTAAGGWTRWRQSTWRPWRAPSGGSTLPRTWLAESTSW